MLEENEPTTTLPLPHLIGQTFPTGVMPSVVRDARLLTILAILFCCIAALAFMFRENGGGSNMATTSLEIALYTGFGILLIWHLRQLKRGTPVAWKLQLVLSCIGLIGFPLGTLLHVLILLNWFKPETKAWFKHG